jgi:beta-carotene hydroxylase
VDVCDRGGDGYEARRQARQAGRHFLVRARRRRDRLVFVPPGQDRPGRLPDHARALPSPGEGAVESALRSGRAYQAAHLLHHARYPHADDVEASAARRSWPWALAEGFVFPSRIWLGAVRNARQARAWDLGEGAACLALAAAAVALSPVTSVPLIYVALLVAGVWVIPLATARLPHVPRGKSELFQTRAFRGVVASVVGLEHLYHLEHHLYPSVPHHNWPRLARRLDPYLARAGVRPVRFWL